MIQSAIEAPAKPYVSPSQLDMYCRCGESYRRRYLEGERIPPGIAMLLGTGVHKGAELNFRQKIESHADLAAKDIIAASVAAFETETRVGYCLSEEEAARGSKVVLGEAKDQVADLANLFAAEVAPEYQPVLVEEPVRIVLPNCPRDLYGIMDLADDKRRVIDHKTAGKRKSQDEIDASPALTYYAAAHRARTGQPASEVRLEVLVKLKRPVRQTLISHRGEADFQALANRINAVVGGIDAGVFPPAVPGSWWCASRWCGYHATCPYINSERLAKSAGAE